VVRHELDRRLRILQEIVMARSTVKKTTKKVLAMPATATARAASATPSAQDVAQRAFELYCARGQQDGFDLEDWLQAERELVAAKTSSAATAM
jgi:outer membrane protein TolC